MHPNPTVIDVVTPPTSPATTTPVKDAAIIKPAQNSTDTDTKTNATIPSKNSTDTSSSVNQTALI